MIELPRTPIDLAQPRIKVLGIGNAGSNALDRVVLDGLDRADLIAVNTDAQVLTGSVASRKIQIGQSITRGLGAGGDPEVGREAAMEDQSDLRQVIGDGNIVILVVGLGGGTGSGAAPLIAEIAREQGAMVVVVATVPFNFEGKRRVAQAEEALAQLRQNTDVLLCFDNDKM
ncbi:MAG TPA: cell division protein FtsZ, partial [Chthoniobacteraceae bacterium]|nr:cell division protein FtsZ [Chthoniobacteraceae bacterium]